MSETTGFRMCTCMECGRTFEHHTSGIPQCPSCHVLLSTRGSDPVHHPPHYTRGKIEVADFIEDQQFNWHIGNVVKYLCRAGFKDDALQDYRKAQWYLDRYIKLLERK